MPPSKDYEAFNTKVSGDVSQASFSAQSLEKKSIHTKVRIRESCLPELIPNGSTLEIEQVQFHHLRFGDLILVRDKKEIVIRRYINFEVRGPSEVVIHVVNQHWKIAEEFRDSSVSGRILMAESKGEHFNPYKKESASVRFKNWMTHFGTSTPFGRLVARMKFLGSLVGRKK